MLRILVVDDDNEVRSVMRRQLECMSHTVTDTNSPQSALSLLDKSAFDLVITDVEMKAEIDGFALSRIVKERWKTPVMVMSGNVYPDNEKVFDAFLHKPYKYEQLHALIEVIKP